MKFEDVVHKDLYSWNGFYREVFWGIEQYIDLKFLTDYSGNTYQKEYGERIWGVIQEC